MADLSFKFGTPKPIVFQEPTMKGTEQEVRIRGSAIVTEWHSRYGEGDVARDAIKICLLSILPKCVQDLATSSSMIRNNAKGSLAERVRKELAANGVTAVVEIIGIDFTEESNEKQKEMLRESIKNMTSDISLPLAPKPMGTLPLASADKIVRPRTDSEKSVGNDEMFKRNRETDKFCRFCGTKRHGGARFCSECGVKYGE